MNALAASTLVTSASALNLVVRLVALMLLARLLEPQHFGVVALAFGIQSVLGLIAQLDVRDALIQSPTISTRHLRLAWITLWISSVVFFGILVLVAPTLERWIKMDDLAFILSFIGLSIFFDVLVGPIEAVLIRRGNARVIARGTIYSYAIGFALVGVLAAWLAPGAAALALAYVAMAAARLCAFWIGLRRMPADSSVFAEASELTEFQILRDLMRFSVFGTLNRLFTTLNKQVDNFVVGLTLGAVALGFYSRAYTLAATPAETLLGMTIRSVVFPELASMQNDRVRFGSAVGKAFSAAMLILMPISISLAVLGPEVVSIVFGQGWETAVVPLQCLSLAMALRFGPRLAVAVGRALGRQRILLLLNFVAVGLTVVLVWRGALDGGIVGASIAMLAGTIVHFMMAVALAARLSGLRVSRLLLVLLRPGSLMLAFTVCLFGLADILRTGLDTPVVTLLGATTGASTLCLVLLLIRPRSFLGDWERDLICRFVRKLLPNKLGRFIDTRLQR